MNAHSGQCLCGDVQFETPEPSHIGVCHCGQCQKWACGPFVSASFDTPIVLTKTEGLTWFSSSDWAKRGFCKTCGSSLFYRLNHDENFWAVSAGTLNISKDHALHREIFVDSKPDYYNFSGDHPRLTGAQVIAESKASNKDD